MARLATLTASLRRRLNRAKPLTGVTAAAPSAQHLTDAFLARVKRSYRLATQAPGQTGALWNNIQWYQASVHSALMSDDHALLRAVFLHPERTDLYYGVDNLCHTVLSSLKARPDFAQVQTDNAELSNAHIIKLAEAVGAKRWLPLDGEMAPLYRNRHEPDRDADQLLDAIEDAAGFKLAFPAPFEDEMGLPTGRGLIPYRSLQAIYQVHRLRQEVSQPDAAILEIGPGMGRTAYYARLSGLKNYTTLDLPMGTVAQACFLGATLGPSAVWMAGDDPQDAASRIRILPATLPWPEQRFDVVLNVDSLTEMGVDPGMAYGEWIATHADTFLSINHEANLPTVAAIAARHFAAARSRRFPCWMRNGYVEELYDFTARA